jgi:hypothetical protein
VSSVDSFLIMLACARYFVAVRKSCPIQHVERLVLCLATGRVPRVSHVLRDSAHVSVRTLSGFTSRKSVMEVVLFAIYG